MIFYKIFRGIIIGLGLSSLIFTLAPVVNERVYSPFLAIEKPIKRVRGAARPLKDPFGDRYCSSSIVKYKSALYTVTNRHCCNAYSNMFKKGYRKIGDNLEKILMSSNSHDLCILTSKNKRFIKLAKKPAKLYERVMVMGYPKGNQLTPRFGHIIQESYNVCLNHRNGERKCENAVLSSTLVYPGNSGSPLVNMDGELVGVVCGGNFSVSFGISVQLKYVKEALEYARKIHGR